MPNSSACVVMMINTYVHNFVLWETNEKEFIAEKESKAPKCNWNVKSTEFRFCGSNDRISGPAILSCGKSDLRSTGVTSLTRRL